MLADPEFARFSQEIGLASLGASDKEIEKLAAIYWFTVEVGMCRQDGQLKAYGASILSAFGELAYALSDKPEMRPFVASEVAIQEIEDQKYQPTYFVADSFTDIKEKIKQYAKNIEHPFEAYYDSSEEIIKLKYKKNVQNVN